MSMFKPLWQQDSKERGQETKEASSSDEEKFIRQIFEPMANCKVLLSIENRKKINQHLFFEAGHPSIHFGENIGCEINLQEEIIRLISTPNLAMVFIEDDQVRENILLKYIKYAVIILRDLFEIMYPKVRLRTDFLERLEKCLFLSAWISFDRDQVRQSSQASVLLGGYESLYVRQHSYAHFNCYLVQDYNLLHSLYNNSALAVGEKVRALKAAESFYNEIRSEYLKNTIPLSNFLSKLIALAVVAFLLLSSLKLLGLPYTCWAGPIVLVMGWIAEKSARNLVDISPRKLRPEICRKINNQVAVVEKHLSRPRNYYIEAYELIMDSNDAKIAAAISLRYSAEVSKRWQRLKLEDRKKQITQSRDETDGRDWPICILAKSTEEVKPPVLFDAVTKATLAYHRVKKIKIRASVEETQQEQRQETKIIDYKLTAEQKTRGFLMVRSSKSLGFFAFNQAMASSQSRKNYKTEIEEMMGAERGKEGFRLENGIIYHSAGKGRFNGIELLVGGTDRAELKGGRGDTRRLFFNKTSETIEVNDTYGEKHLVNVWEPVEMRKY